MAQDNDFHERLLQASVSSRPNPSPGLAHHPCSSASCWRFAAIFPSGRPAVHSRTSRLLLPLAVGAGGPIEEFSTVLLWTIPLAIVAFLVCGAFLVLLWQSFARESDDGEESFTPRSRRRMIYLIVSLIFFGLIFAWLAFNAP